MFLSDLITAMTKELQTFFADLSGTVILDTGLAQDISGSLPLCIFCIEDSGDSAHLPGQGITRMDYELYFKIYPFEPNSYLSNDSGYSASLADVIDNLRNHLNSEIWLCQEMIDLTTNYAFRIEYQGTTKAEPLQMEAGLCIGFNHHFSSIAFDNTTQDGANGNTTNVNSGTVVFD